MAKIPDSDMWNDINFVTAPGRIGLVGDGRSIHIRRWARWLRSRGKWVAMLSTTDIQGEDIQAELKDDYDMMWTIKMRDGPLGYLSAIIMLRGFIREYKLDMVHGMYLTSGGFMAVWSGCKHKVVSAWGSDMFQDAEKSRLKRLMIKSALKHADMIFVSSIALEEAVLELYPNCSTQITRYGANLEAFRPRGIRKYDKFTFLSIRKSERLYQPLDILHAFEEIASGMDARLLFQRPDSSYHDLVLAIWNSPFKERIGFWDEREHDLMPLLYGPAHVGISIPDTDGCSAAVMECMACGTPVIMLASGDVELVHPILCADPASHQHQLADVMRFAYDTWDKRPDRWDEFGREARTIAERYGNFDIQMMKVERYYLKLFGRMR